MFDRAYAHAPQTLPSHASMFTGRLPFEHKVRDNLGFTLSDGTATLASMFKAAGYATGGFVSAYVLRPETGIGQGFDVYDARFPAMAADRSAAQVQRSGPQTLAAAEAWLKGITSDRFFLFLHLYEPHTPYRAPERFADLAAYDGEVAFADEIVGNLFSTLEGTRLVRHGDDRRARRITARAWATTSRKSTGCSSMTKWSACRGSCGCHTRSRPGDACAIRCSTSTWCQRWRRPRGSKSRPDFGAAILRSQRPAAALWRLRAFTPKRSIRAITSAGASFCR